jgi:glycosyltransferase involved in cell wall biosynthesis
VVDDLVSIIVPAFDAAAWIGECLDSCAHQTHRDFEVVVVDDGSGDATAELADAFATRDPTRFRVLRASHAGPGAARNAGVGLARGRWLYFLDADDRVEPTALARALVRLRETGADTVVGDWFDFGASGADLAVRRSGAFRYPGDALASVVFRPVVLSAVVFPRTPATFDEAVMRCEGMKYIWDALLARPWVVQIAEPFSRVRQRTDAQRLTRKHDHFEPGYNFDLHAALKARLRVANALTPAREEAIDYQLLRYAYAAVRRGDDVPELAEFLDPARLSQHAWFEPLGAAGFVRALGARRGLRAFHALNRLLGRA